MKPSFHSDGFAIYDFDEAIASWADAAKLLGEAALQDQNLLDRWLYCEGTWFVGVDALDTGPEGQAGTTPLNGQVIRDLADYLNVEHPLHKGQLSVVYPGYPKPREGESEAAFRYRKVRDAAHVDGLHATGENRRRHLHEHHAYLLGIPLTKVDKGAAPLVVWKESHRIVQKWLVQKLGHFAPSDWQSVDLTEDYLNIRKAIFEKCKRVELLLEPGQALVMHRHMLHGIAPWSEDIDAPKEKRMIAYFRPEVSGDLSIWLRDS